MRTHGAVVGCRFRSVKKLTTKVRIGRGYLFLLLPQRSKHPREMVLTPKASTSNFTTRNPSPDTCPKPHNGNVAEPVVGHSTSWVKAEDRTTDQKRSAVISGREKQHPIYRDICVASTAHNNAPPHLLNADAAKKPTLSIARTRTPRGGSLYMCDIDCSQQQISSLFFFFFLIFCTRRRRQSPNCRLRVSTLRSA